MVIVRCLDCRDCRKGGTRLPREPRWMSKMAGQGRLLSEPGKLLCPPAPALTQCAP